MTVLLIGNGPSVMDAPLGKTIDSYEKVFRINLFNTREPFTRYAGKKTTGWFLSPAQNHVNSLTQSCGYGCNCPVYITPDPRNEKTALTNTQKLADHLQATGRGVIKVPKGHALWFMGKFGIWPTTGLVAIHYLLGFSPHVVIHGFDIALEEGQYHQYMNKDQKIFKVHNIEKEKKAILDMVDEGRVSFLKDQLS